MKSRTSRLAGLSVKCEALGCGLVGQADLLTHHPAGEGAATSLTALQGPGPVVTGASTSATTSRVDALGPELAAPKTVVLPVGAAHGAQGVVLEHEPPIAEASGASGVVAVGSGVVARIQLEERARPSIAYLTWSHPQISHSLRADEPCTGPGAL